MREQVTPIVVGGDAGGRSAPATASFRRPASWVLWATALIFLIGSVLDLLVLWVFQRQPTPQWEFISAATTAEGLPRIVLGVALAWGALLLRDSRSLMSYRLLALTLIGVGLLGAVIGALMVSDYFILRDAVNPEAIRQFQGGVFKTLALCAMYVFILLPVGVLAFRRPRSP